MPCPAQIARSSAPNERKPAYFANGSLILPASVSAFRVFALVIHSNSNFWICSSVFDDKAVRIGFPGGRARSCFMASATA